MKCRQKFTRSLSGLLFGVVVFAVSVLGVSFFAQYQNQKNEISFDEAVQRLRSKQIKEVVFKDNNVKFSAKSAEIWNVSNVSDSQTGAILEEVYNSDDVKVTYEANSQFMARLFQILFILFIVSPPLMVLMLFLIWQELKERRKNK